jgi:hypothetical protein
MLVRCCEPSEKSSVGAAEVNRTGRERKAVFPQASRAVTLMRLPAHRRSSTALPTGTTPPSVATTVDATSWSSAASSVNHRRCASLTRQPARMTGGVVSYRQSQGGVPRPPPPHEGHGGSGPGGQE